MKTVNSLLSGTFIANDQYIFRDPGYHVWCGSVIPWNDEWWLFYSRWPEQTGFSAWSTRSEIAIARGQSPCGPFIPTGQTILPNASGSKWDACVAHNPTACLDGERILLAYTGNFGQINPGKDPVLSDADSPESILWWEHRNNQRIGVATAPHPTGPWQSPAKPTLDITPDGWDNLAVNNPALLKQKNGNWLLCYKGVSDGPRPFGGSVRHGIAIASNPLGPYRKIKGIHPFNSTKSNFPAEDPFIWWDDEALVYRAIVKDMEGTFTGSGPSLALFRSADAFHWQPEEPALVMDKTVRWQAGKEEYMERLERPQLTFDKTGKLVALQVACLPKRAGAAAFSLSFALNDSKESIKQQAVAFTFQQSN
jgi:hypothetical protein